MKPREDRDLDRLLWHKVQPPNHPFSHLCSLEASCRLASLPEGFSTVGRPEG